MGSKSKSRSSSATSNNQRQISLDASNNDGIALSSGGDAALTLNMSDQGAINGALNFATAASNNSAGVARDSNRIMQQVATASMNNSAGVARDSNRIMQQVATASMNNSAGLADRSLDFAEEYGALSYDFAESVFSQALDSVNSESNARFQNQAEYLGSIAQASKSENAQALDKITTYLFLTVAGVAAVFVLRGAK